MLQIILAMKCYKQAQLPPLPAVEEDLSNVSLDFKYLVKKIEKDEGIDLYNDHTSEVYHPKSFMEAQPIDEKLEFRTPFNCMSLMTQRHLNELRIRLRRPKAIYPNKEYNEVVLPKYIHRLIFLFKRHNNSCKAFLEWFHAQLRSFDRYFISVYLTLVQGVDRDQGQYLVQLWRISKEMDHDDQASQTRENKRMLEMVYNRNLLEQHNEKNPEGTGQTLINEEFLHGEEVEEKVIQQQIMSDDDDDSSDSDFGRYE